MGNIGIGGKMMTKTKIETCDYTFNPVIGCKNNCSYCYAKRINDRFKFIKNWNNPEWKEKSFNKKFPNKPQRIFVGSMSEIYHWEKRWVRDTLNKVLEYPQHTFQFLTKFSDIYSQWYFHPNCWLGVTITQEKDFSKGISYDFICSKNITFLSIEPILEQIDPNLFSELNINWVILGSESGKSKGKVIPKLDWITDIVEYCRNNKIPVYLKDSIMKLYPNLAFEYPNFHKFPGFYDKEEKR